MQSLSDEVVSQLATVQHHFVNCGEYGTLDTMDPVQVVLVHAARYDVSEQDFKQFLLSIEGMSVKVRDQLIQVKYGFIDIIHLL
jgi:hypothetical protein